MWKTLFESVSSDFLASSRILAEYLRVIGWVHITNQSPLHLYSHPVPPGQIVSIIEYPGLRAIATFSCGDEFWIFRLKVVTYHTQYASKKYYLWDYITHSSILHITINTMVIESDLRQARDEGCIWGTEDRADVLALPPLEKILHKTKKIFRQKFSQIIKRYLRAITFAMNRAH